MSTFDRILDSEDERVAPYRALQSDAAVRRRGFIAEGWVVLEKALSHGRCPLASILVCDRHEARLVQLLHGSDTQPPVYLAEQRLLDRICGFPVHRGVLAHGPEPDPPSADALLGDLTANAVLVCAVGVNDSHNMGAIFRNAAAFGAAVLLDATCCDPLYRRAIRVSVGAALTTPFARSPPGEDLLALLHRHGFKPLALTPQGSTPLKAIAPAGRTAVLVGAEGPGLPEAVLARAQTVRIPMADDFDSLNVACALAVCLHHLSASVSE